MYVCMYVFTPPVWSTSSTNVLTSLSNGHVRWTVPCKRREFKQNCQITLYHRNKQDQTVNKVRENTIYLAIIFHPNPSPVCIDQLICVSSFTIHRPRWVGDCFVWWRCMLHFWLQPFSIGRFSVFSFQASFQIISYCLGMFVWPMGVSEPWPFRWFLWLRHIQPPRSLKLVTS